MLILSIVLFCIGAIFGLTILSAILRDKPTPKLNVLAHGTFVILAFLILVSSVISNPNSTLLITSVVLFALAALGGLTLLSFDLRNRPIPKVIAVIHPLVAVSALVCLIISVVQYGT